MTIKNVRTLQIIALILAGIAVILCCLVMVRPEWLGIKNLGEIRAVPTAALVHSVGFAAVGLFYLVMLLRSKTAAGNKGTVIVTAMLLVILTVIIEPIVSHQESLQIQMIQAQTDDAAAMIALIAAKQGVREWIRLILYVSGALSFLSMGGFWGKCVKEEET